MPAGPEHRGPDAPRVARFVVNGVVATAVNYAVLAVLIDGLQVRYAGVAALIAALAGITASFVGNRIFVFRSRGPLLVELLRFKTLYGAVAIFQALFLAGWSDLLRLDYRPGFVLVVGISTFISYFGSKRLVFR